MIFDRNRNNWNKPFPKPAKKNAKKPTSYVPWPYGWGYGPGRDSWGNLIGRDQYGNLLPKRTREQEHANSCAIDVYNSPEAKMARSLKLSMRFKLLDRKMSVMNCLPVGNGWMEQNPRFQETNKVVRLSFYLRTIVKTCFLHLKEGLPNLPSGLVEHILEYADDHLFVVNALNQHQRFIQDHNVSPTTTLYSVLAHKFLDF